MYLISRSRIDNYLRRYFVNIIIGVLSVFLFIGFNLDPNRGASAAFSKWGVPSSYEIRDGKIWGLVTCNFLESNLILLVFGLGWLWTLGIYIEEKVGSRYYAWFILSSCIFTTTMEIAFFGASGYGFGAITCSMFGFVFVRSLSDSSWVIRKETGIKLLLWVIICFSINYWQIYRIAYGGFVFGFMWGSFLAYCSTLRYRWYRIAVPLVVLGFCAIPIKWAPWSIDWLKHEAYKYEQQEKYDLARTFLSRVLSKDPTDKEAQEGLQSVRISELSSQAYSYHIARDYERAKITYRRILDLDPNNDFAKTNLQQITVQEMDHEAYELWSNHASS